MPNSITRSLWASMRPWSSAGKYGKGESDTEIEISDDEPPRTQPTNPRQLPIPLGTWLPGQGQRRRRDRPTPVWRRVANPDPQIFSDLPRMTTPLAICERIPNIDVPGYVEPTNGPMPPIPRAWHNMAERAGIVPEWYDFLRVAGYVPLTYPDESGRPTTEWYTSTTRGQRLPGYRRVPLPRRYSEY